MRVVEFIKENIINSPSFKELVAKVTAHKNAKVVNCVGSARAFYVAALFEALERQIISIFCDDEAAKDFYDDLVQIVSPDNVGFFPAMGKKLWTELGPSSQIVGRRILTLKALLSGKRNIIITSAEAMLEKVASPTSIKKEARTITTNSSVDFQEFLNYLFSIGYNREMRTERPGDMSVRGGIVDLFPFDEENPIRIEFNGDFVESIRTFDVESQRSLMPRLSVELIPLGASGLYGSYIDQPYDRISLNATLFDYFGRDAIIVMDDNLLLNRCLGEHEENNKNRFNKFCQQHNILNEITFQEFYSDAKDIIDKFNNFNLIDIKSFIPAIDDHTIDCAMQKSGSFAGNLSLFKQEIDLLEKRYEKENVLNIMLACESQRQVERMQELFKQEKYSPRLQIIELNVAEGFLWPEKNLYLYTSREIYGRKRYVHASSLRQRSILLVELLKFKENDYVVHVDYGVGIFRGLEIVSSYGKKRECIKIEYADGDMLYVPLEKMDRVQKYSSREGYLPTLNKLGTKDWQRIKSKTKKRIKDIAEDLIKLYAKRKMSPGFAFSPDSIWQKELEASFPYEETIDQIKAIEDIKRDMEAAVPMDRLICGDVGFGKTEVAVRAAFKAINDNKQVALLVPTTVLAQQHYNTFMERLNRFPVKIEVLSRFKTPMQQQEILRRLAAGDVDLVIGTHRILSDDVKFKALGLLIIDEEHKFGVIHKEKLKLLKMNVDTISLSATPIPRTMHMGLIGVRDLSVINTPPENRQPIQTEVCLFDKALIREIILKECSRGGQVYFVHNRVGTIYAMTQLLRELIPEISIATAHGQMSAGELEKIMLKFAAGEIQCLVCTLIVESGLDIPNANTLIVNRADKLGLSQLYQLRGRIGRSNQQAYAYFLVPPIRTLTKNAIRRLQTIQEFSYLGSGYKIALRDMEIRGAGNIFGAEQSGFINVLGFELFSKIIEEAIQELRGELALPVLEATKEQEDNSETRIEFTSPALLPADYVPLVEDRVDLYRRLIESKDEQSIQLIAKEIRDRFGPLPPPAENLIEYLLLKKLARRANIEEITFHSDIAIGKFNSRLLPKGEQFRAWIGKIVSNAKQPFEFKQLKDQLIFELELQPKHSAISQVKNFLQNII